MRSGRTDKSWPNFGTASYRGQVDKFYGTKSSETARFARAMPCRRQPQVVRGDRERQDAEKLPQGSFGKARLQSRLVYVRAAMIIGPGSASYDILEHLIRRLPVMIVPRWLDTKTQPIALSDVVRALADVAERETAPEELQLGGAEVLTYREMMRRAAPLMGRRPPLVIRVPVLTPRLSSYWVALVTPVSYGLVKPLVDGLGAEMVVDRDPPPGLNDEPLGFEDAVREALQA